MRLSFEVNSIENYVVAGAMTNAIGFHANGTTFRVGWLKQNTDGSSLSNPGKWLVRKKLSETSMGHIPHATSIQAESWALQDGLIPCCLHSLLTACFSWRQFRLQQGKQRMC
ncbi:hypothetical protein V6N13_134905 [Hibiscus sabdariffa]|uniref:Uncharacterized protein n=1 Tax=Hibiscus sabdariffa TaxID=183260 RepID=A0ABR2R5G7_9ROSI